MSSEVTEGKEQKKRKLSSLVAGDKFRLEPSSPWFRNSIPPCIITRIRKRGWGKKIKVFAGQGDEIVTFSEDIDVYVV